MQPRHPVASSIASRADERSGGPTTSSSSSWERLGRPAPARRALPSAADFARLDGLDQNQGKPIDRLPGGLPVPLQDFIDGERGFALGVSPGDAMLLALEFDQKLSPLAVQALQLVLDCSNPALLRSAVVASQARGARSTAAAASRTARDSSHASARMPPRCVARRAGRWPHSESEGRRPGSKEGPAP